MNKSTFELDNIDDFSYYASNNNLWGGLERVVDHEAERKLKEKIDKQRQILIQTVNQFFNLIDGYHIFFRGDNKVTINELIIDTSLKTERDISFKLNYRHEIIVSNLITSIGVWNNNFKTKGELIDGIRDCDTSYSHAFIEDTESLKRIMEKLLSSNEYQVYVNNIRERIRNFFQPNKFYFISAPYSTAIPYKLNYIENLNNDCLPKDITLRFSSCSIKCEDVIKNSDNFRVATKEEIDAQLQREIESLKKDFNTKLRNLKDHYIYN